MLLVGPRERCKIPKLAQKNNLARIFVEIRDAENTPKIPENRMVKCNLGDCMVVYRCVAGFRLQTVIFEILCKWGFNGLS